MIERMITRPQMWGRSFVWAGLWGLFLIMETATSVFAAAPNQAVFQADKLYKVGQELVDQTHYFEALDLLDEARDILETAGATNTSLYGDVLFSLAETKIKGRMHQNFPAYYVKTALREVQAANKLRDKLTGVLPQKLAEGYYLEGYIDKRFFMRNKLAKACLEKAVRIDPGSVAAKRELSELITTKGGK
jgi:tetratricopeptide (TPR) repeat protein